MVAGVNAKRRSAIEAVRKLLDQSSALLQQATEEIDAIRDEEQEAYDALPESLQGGDRGDAMQQAIEALDSAFNDLEAINLDDILGALEEAAQ